MSDATTDTQQNGQPMSEILFNYTKKHALLFVIFFLVYETATYIANDMIMPGMISVVHAFHAPDSYVPTSLAAFILGGASLQIFLGPLSDRYGRRPIMLAGALWLLLTTIFISFSMSIHQFILARFLQGMSLCFIGVVGYAALQELFAEKYAVRLTSLMANVTIMAPLLGPLLGSFVMAFGSWRYIFYCITVVAIISLWGLARYMPETIGQVKRDGSCYAPTPLKPSVLFKNYFKLLTHFRFMCGSIAIGLAFAPMIAWIGVSPLMLMKASHLSVLYYGMLQIPIFFMTFLGSIYMRTQLENQSLQALAWFGSIIISSSLVLMSLVLFLNSHYAWIIAGLSVYAFGVGYVSGPLNRMILFFTNVPTGTTSALANIICMGTLALAVEIGGMCYRSFNNVYFGLFCAVCGIAYALAFYCMSRGAPSKQLDSSAA